MDEDEPCPCGSGRNYKRCCFEKLEHSASPGLDDLHAQLESAIERASEESPEDAQRILDEVMRAHNAGAVDDFHGLSPSAMGALLYEPFDSPGVVEVPPLLDSTPTAGAVVLLERMIAGIGDGVRGTPKRGNLPRHIVQDATAAFDRQREGLYPVYKRVRNEEEVFELHGLRVACETGDLIAYDNNRFSLTKKCRELLERGGMRALYPELLKAWAREFNWAYLDGYDDLPGIQEGVMFSLFLLCKYGDEFRPADFYVNAFLGAFPMVLEETEGSRYDTPAEHVAQAFALRTLDRFAVFFGLAEAQGSSLAREYRATPLLADAVRFK